MIGFINVNDFLPNYGEFRAAKKKCVDFILFPVVFQPGKEMQGWT